MKRFPALLITIELNLCIFECLSFGRVFLFCFCGVSDIHLHICLFFNIGIVSRLDMLEVLQYWFSRRQTQTQEQIVLSNMLWKTCKISMQGWCWWLWFEAISPSYALWMCLLGAGWLVVFADVAELLWSPISRGRKSYRAIAIRLLVVVQCIGYWVLSMQWGGLCPYPCKTPTSIASMQCIISRAKSTLQPGWPG